MVDASRLNMLGRVCEKKLAMFPNVITPAGEFSLKSMIFSPVHQSSPVIVDYLT